MEKPLRVSTLLGYGSNSPSFRIIRVVSFFLIPPKLPMKPIAHRGLWRDRQEQNTLRALHDAFELSCGVETDVRSFKGQLYLSHDPIIDPVVHAPFEALLELSTYYPRLPVFLNIKEDGLLPLLNRYRTRIEKINAVFFDMSVPELIHYAKSFPPNFLATRVSEFEISPAANELCDWIWLDSFTRDPQQNRIKEMVSLFTKNWAFVSPELHGREKNVFWKTLQSSDFLPKGQTFLCTDYAEEFLRSAG